MEHIHNNLMKLGGSQSNLKKIEKKLLKINTFWTISPFSKVQSIQYKLYSWKWTNSPKYIEFLKQVFFYFYGTLPSDPPNINRW
jgi:hypothetical protein